VHDKRRRQAISAEQSRGKIRMTVSHARVLYDLSGTGDRRFSPYCWRVKLALAHKGLAFETQAVPFTGIPALLGGRFKTVPILDDGGTLVADSLAIADYLEDTYHGRPSLYGGPGGRAATRFVDRWAVTQLHVNVLKIVIRDIHDRLEPADQGYFRRSREARFSMPLEQLEDKSAARVEAVRSALEPLRATLALQPFLGGKAPLMPDYCVFGTLQWARVTSSVALLAGDDTVHAWFERCLDLYDGLGRRAVTA
jgi:glutathione S-transferase